MDNSKKILHLIRLSATLLSETGPLYKEIKNLDKNLMLKKLGNALSNLFEIDQAVCGLEPELVSDQWKLINNNKEKYRAEFNKLDDAIQAENDNNLQLAKKLFDEILESTEIKDNKIRAQAGLYRINSIKEN